MERVSFSTYQVQKKKKAPPHPLSACAEQIKEAKLFTEKYKRGYWLRLLSQYCKRRNCTPEGLYTELHGILKGIATMDEKYNKGGRLTNILMDRKKI